MAKLASLSAKAPTAPVTSLSEVPDALTYEGGAGFSRDAKSELFLLAVTNMVSEKTFYEDAGARDSRFRNLVTQVARENPDWLAAFIPYLRNTMNMRSASIVMAAEAVKARLDAGQTKNRDIISSALVRADEPAEMIGYWISRWGKNIPKPVRRGVGDAVKRLYTERNFLKYGGNDGIRMADVLEIVHPDNRGIWQRALYEFILQDRHNRANLQKPIRKSGDKLSLVDLDTQLPILAARKRLEAIPVAERLAIQLVGVDGVTWEWASSWYGRKLDADFWTALIPQMGYMALLRNLRNFDDAKVPDDIAGLVAAKLTDPEEVAKSRQFPLRFAAAFDQINSLRWAYPLEQALQLTLQNVPALSGKTLILVDNSTSMDGTLSGRSKMRMRDAAALFGAALALRAEEATLVAYANEGIQIPVRSAQAVQLLRKAVSSATSGGTETMQVLMRWYHSHDRVIILTDEQAFNVSGTTYTGAWGGYRIGEIREVPDQVSGITAPIYTFNLAGYAKGHLPSGSANRYTFGGLTDAGFTAIDMLEKGRDVNWAFLKSSTPVTTEFEASTEVDIQEE